MRGRGPGRGPEEGAEYGICWDKYSKAFATAFRGPRSGVVCHREGRRPEVLVSVSGMLLSRQMDGVVRGPEEAKALTLPKTVRRVRKYAF